MSAGLELVPKLDPGHPKLELGPKPEPEPELELAVELRYLVEYPIES